MRYGHGTTSNSPKEQRRRREQPARDEAKREQNRQRAKGGGKPNELGVIQGQNGEQGETVNRSSVSSGSKLRH